KEGTSPLLSIPIRREKSTIVCGESPCQKVNFSYGYKRKWETSNFVKHKFTGNDIHLEIIYMDEVSPESCTDDSPFRLDFFDDHSISPVHRLYSVCSKTTYARIHSSSMALRYRKKSTETRGFFLKYHAVCTEMHTFGSLTGTIRSPSFPYPPMVNRQLKIIFHSVKAKNIGLSNDPKNGRNVKCRGYVFRL
ncbi:hypothetical protein PMAYCL1PPCAC_28339, partial [Pristionchus mayeri]